MSRDKDGARRALPISRLRSAAGMAVPLVVVILIVFAVIGAGLAYLSRTAGRMGHWYHHGQMAFDLAQAGLKEALMAFEENSKPMGGSGTLPAASQKAMDDMLKILLGQASRPPPDKPITLFQGDGDSPAQVTMTLATMLDELGHDPDYHPNLKVEVRFLPEQPLAAGPVQGILPIPTEKRGDLKITASATVTPETTGAIAVKRTLIAFRGYKVISILPPIVSKFPLFFIEPPAPEKLNVLAVKFDTGTGDGKPQGTGLPLRLENVYSSNAGVAGKNIKNVDWSAVAPAGFLDQQGWVFLGSGAASGGAGAAASWKLDLAYGYTGSGENFHLPNTKRRLMVDDALLQRVENAFQSELTCDFSFDRTNPLTPYGLLAFYHGLADNYEEIGYFKRQELIRNGNRVRVKVSPHPVASSVFRLMGTADEMAPTVVLGNVDRVYLRQTAYFGNFVTRCANLFGPQEIALYFWDDHARSTHANERNWINVSWQSEQNYKRLGTALVEEPYIISLFRILGPRTEGTVLGHGFVSPGGSTTPGPKPFASALVPELANIQPPGPAGVDLDALRAGKVKIGKHFQGDLNVGLDGLQAVMAQKLVRKMKTSELKARWMPGGQLKLPGVVLIEDPTLDLQAIPGIVAGGLLLCQGDININGDITGAAGEPLTIVSLGGSVRIGSGVRNLDAFLVSVQKSVILRPGSDLTVAGGLAARHFDLDWAGSAGKRTVKFVKEFDPTAPGADSKFLRAFPLPEVRIMTSGDAS